MQFAIIGIGGKQFRIEKGDIIVAEKVADTEGKIITINHVFLVADGENITIGDPIIKEASVEAKVLYIKKGKKIRVFKHKPRKRYHVEKGHRQFEMKLEIMKINT